MNYAMILSGGTGSRLKGIAIPKQYYEICGKSILQYTVETIANSSKIDRYIIVASKSWHAYIRDRLHGIDEKFAGFALPGQNRQLSIYHGLSKLKDIAKENDIVLIHDAARPCVSERMICNCIEACSKADGAMPVLPMKDTIYLSKNGNSVESLLNRSELFAGQAPEAFVFGKYMQANMKLSEEQMMQINGSSEPAILDGLQIVMTDGEESNFKITTAQDLERFIGMQKE